MLQGVNGLIQWCLVKWYPSPWNSYDASSNFDPDLHYLLDIPFQDLLSVENEMFCVKHHKHDMFIQELNYYLTYLYTYKHIYIYIFKVYYQTKNRFSLQAILKKWPHFWSRWISLGRCRLVDAMRLRKRSSVAFWSKKIGDSWREGALGTWPRGPAQHMGWIFGIWLMFYSCIFEIE